MMNQTDKSMSLHVSDIVDCGLRISSVHLKFFDNDKAFITQILLCFDNNYSICIKVNDDTDELILMSGPQDGDGEYHEAITIFPEIKNIYGTKPHWSWSLVNNQGYSDGLQVDFFDEIKHSYFEIQFKAMASTIEIYKIQQILPLL